ncbi:hypothetical protein ACNKHL_19815 [Shigella flexneri]
MFEFLLGILTTTPSAGAMWMWVNIVAISIFYCWQGIDGFD